MGISGRASLAGAISLCRTAEKGTTVLCMLPDTGEHVVMFAFEYCEFCWSVRRMFERCKISYRSVDLDTAEFQQDDRGGRIRAALLARTAFT